LSSPEDKPLVFGRVSGFRGGHGEVTVKVVSGDAARWAHLRRVELNGSGPGIVSGSRTVDAARAYRDRLVLKLAGVDDANAAAALTGCDVAAAAEDVPKLPEDSYWVERLVGARVNDAALGEIGLVKDVIETGGVDVLVVADAAGVETLVPMVKAFVSTIDEANGTIGVSLPAGLRGLNADHGRGTL
jgi:16S rRNA processing protein RimM